MVKETAVGEGIKACTIGLNFHQGIINSLRNFGYNYHLDFFHSLILAKSITFASLKLKALVGAIHELPLLNFWRCLIVNILRNNKQKINN
jgi:hypothetical protein